MKVRMNYRSCAWRMLLCVGILLGAFGTASAQGSWTVEEIFADGNGQWIPYKVAATSDGGSVTIGLYGRPGDFYPYVLRTDWKGNLLWSRVYRVQSFEYDMSIIETRKGDLVWCTGVYVSSYTTSDALVVRLNADGDVQDARLFGYDNNANETATSIIEDSQQELTFCGTSDYYGSRQNLVVHMDGTAGPLWLYTYDMTEDDQAFCIREVRTDEADNDLVVAGEVEFCSGYTAGHYLLLKSNGSPRWAHWYSANRGGGFRSVVQTGEKRNLYATGSWTDGAISQVLINQADVNDGSQVDAMRYDIKNENRSDEGWSIIAGLKNQSVIVAGIANIENRPSRVFAMELPQFGIDNPDWIKTYGQDYVAKGHSIALSYGNSDTEEGYWITGPLSEKNPPDEFWYQYLIRTNLRGADYCYDDSDSKPERVKDNGGLEIKQNDFRFVKDFDLSYHKTGDYKQLCYADYLDNSYGKQAVNNNTEAAQSLQLRVFPNPTSEGKSATLSLNPATAGEVRITLSDLQGRVLFRLDNQVQAGLNEINLETGELNSGIYLLRVQQGEATEMLRITIAK